MENTPFIMENTSSIIENTSSIMENTSSINENISETESQQPSDSTSYQDSIQSGNKGKSWVWQYFKRFSAEEKAICQVTKSTGKICGATFKYNRIQGTSGLTRHLLNIHQLTAIGTSSKSGCLTTFFKEKVIKITPLTRETLKDAIIKLIVRRALPYQIVEYPELRELLALCNPNVRTMCIGADTIRVAILNAFLENKKGLKNYFLEFDSKVNFTCDVWTSPNHKSILGITAYWIDIDWKLRDLVIGANIIMGNHTSVNLGQHILGIFEDYALNNKIFCITADNASSNAVLGNHIEESGQVENFNINQNLLGCMAYIINLATKAGIKALGEVCDDNIIPPSDNPLDIINLLGPRDFDSGNAGSIVDRIRFIAKSFGHSSQCRDRFRAIVEFVQPDATAKTMIQDVPTRWNSTVLMLIRAFDLRSSIDTYTKEESSLQKHSLSKTDWDLIEQVILLLHPFEQATRMLSTNIYPSITTALPVQKLLLQCVNDLVTTYNGSVLLEAVNSIIYKLEQYEAKFTRQQVYFNATILDPRLKLIWFENNGYDHISVVSIRTSFEYNAKQYQYITDQNEYYNREINDSINLFDQIFKRPRRETLEDEINQYLGGPAENGTIDPLIWWKGHSDSFPILARMARIYLSIPATSVPSEQLFSSGRRVVTDFRGSLSAIHMEALMCMQSWSLKEFI